MTQSSNRSADLVRLAATLILSAAASACAERSADGPAGADGPANPVAPVKHQTGSASAGRDVFRFETFGNEGYWTDAIRLPAGIKAAGVTPLMALKLGLSVDSEAIPAAMRSALAAEFKTDLSPARAPLLNDPATLAKLISANAIPGMVAFDSNHDGAIDVASGDKVGSSCAVCHSITDGSVFALPGGGSVGKRVDGPTPHNLQFGKIIATAANSRAFFPLLQLSLVANKGKTLGRAPTGLTKNSSEAEVDAYLSNPAYYPVGMFDDSFDGNGDTMHITPMFRAELSAPWGSEGTFARLDDFNNLVYTGLLDPTGITTPGGRAFVRKLGGMAAGDEIIDDYIAVLAATGVTGYPYVRPAPHPASDGEAAPLGVRVDETKLRDLNAYFNSLPAPAAQVADRRAFERGRAQFRASCTGCHNVDQSRPVSAIVFPMQMIFPGDNPVVLLPMRDAPLNPIMDTPGVFFDDKMAVVNASIRGEKRGLVLPLLLDLARKPSFLHDDSVPSLDALLNPARGASAPHPFYVGETAARADVVEFLRGLDTGS